MTTRLSLIVVAVWALLFATACRPGSTSVSNTNNQSKSSATPDEFAKIREVYVKDCKNCHGDTGAGGPVKRDDGSTLKVPTLREGRAVRHEDTEYIKQITKGGDGMPAFENKLTADQMNELIKMIRKEFQGKQ